MARGRQESLAGPALDLDEGGGTLTVRDTQMTLHDEQKTVKTYKPLEMQFYPGLK